MRFISITFLGDFAKRFTCVFLVIEGEPLERRLLTVEWRAMWRLRILIATFVAPTTQCRIVALVGCGGLIDA
jgi:hypothetical protein